MRKTVQAVTKVCGGGDACDLRAAPSWDAGAGPDNPGSDMPTEAGANCAGLNRAEPADAVWKQVLVRAAEAASRTRKRPKILMPNSTRKMPPEVRRSGRVTCGVWTVE
jgi:hypothetical protein